MTNGPEFQQYMSEQGDREEMDRDCMDCGMCHDCIIRTMETAHEADLARLTRENEELRLAAQVVCDEHAAMCRMLEYDAEGTALGQYIVKLSKLLPAVPEAKDNTPGRDSGKGE